ncbi:MAG: inositol monophosphatase family protein [Gammaproteobacteria bacterium]|nr:inositol monophosphatase family protein [Gammaproteobacteria bacterium]
MHPQVNIAVRAARRAGDIILRALDRLESLKIHEKGHNDFVTEIDLQVEQAMIEIIAGAYPQDSFLTEEQGEIWKDDPDQIWVIDPIDGTLNFLHGFPHFAVSIAKKVNGRVEHGVIYNPVTQDIFTATRGEGASLNASRRLRVSKRAQLSGALIATNLPRAEGEQAAYQEFLEATLPEVGAFRRTGSTVLDLAYVAAGHLDAAICVGFKEWDVAAGILIVREAGGMVTDFKGGDHVLKENRFLASNPKQMKALLPHLKNL